MIHLLIIGDVEDSATSHDPSSGLALLCHNILDHCWASSESLAARDPENGIRRQSGIGA